MSLGGREYGNHEGSFSQTVLGEYVAGGETLAVCSPDWGPIPKSLARNHVIVVEVPTNGYAHAYRTFAGMIVGYSGMNETGLVVCGTAGQMTKDPPTPTPTNGKNQGAMPFLLTGRQISQYGDGKRADICEWVETLFAENPVDGIIAHLTVPGKTCLWEPGAAGVPGYPQNSRRMPGEWDDNSILPLMARGNTVISNRGMTSVPEITNLTITATNGDGQPYAGNGFYKGLWAEMRAWETGKIYLFPYDPRRGEILRSGIEISIL